MVQSTALELLDIARAVAREAGALAATMRSAGISVASTKSSQLDIVTQADTAVETLIRERLLEARPGDAILGEEGGEIGAGSEITWIVDPIDGTVNYLYGSTYYAVSIAATISDEQGDRTSIAGCVFAPALALEYTAAVGEPARLNGDVLQVNTGVPLDKALVSTGIPYDLSKRPRVLQDVTTLMPLIRDFRLVGAAALEICGVAEGRTDGHFQRGLPIWDYAAATLIARQAGAQIRITQTDSASAELLIVASPELADELHPHLV
ncbi:inositol monophosphatase [Herbiconiux sp. VKM Ac-1786]|uniref:inositol monophosphatase family protein n=1 Tax=Herbiconiux sp. VKM Ac-1786 TaxID=2783824 RepID=UPI00188A561F|nr:inositol monophosphatase family protein [Herbiconiux sp. VKM Ac-1786]MBF4574518.1 inositol monophosphatase [Herbiconiux sp. VKM Ac-1786]